MLDGCMPDAVWHPLHLPLALTLLTRVAAKPAQYQLKVGTMNDEYAARELADMLECQFRPIVRLPDGEPLWAVDVCATVALTQVKAQILSRKRKDRDAANYRLENSLKALFSLGVGLCNDVVGCSLPGEIYGKFGMAEKMCGPIESARAKAASARGMGKLGAPSSTRTCSRAARQSTMVNLLCEVEFFLRSGTIRPFQSAAGGVGYGGHQATGASGAQDANGFVEIPSFDSVDVEAVVKQEMSKEAFLQGREQLQNLLFHGPTTLNSFPLDTYVVSHYSRLPCVDCEGEVDVFGGLIFAQMASECSVCCGKRCWRCAMIAGTRMDACATCSAKESAV
jgi:hypothetical protein